MARGEGAKKLVDLFAKYKNTLRAPERSVRVVVAEVISETLGFEVIETKMSYSLYSKIVTLKVPGPMRSEILLHKADILAHVKGRLGEQSAPCDIM